MKSVPEPLSSASRAADGARVPRSPEVSVTGRRVRVLSAVPLLPPLLAAVVFGGWAATGPIADLAQADDKAAVVAAVDATGRVLTALAAERAAASREAAGVDQAGVELTVARDQVDGALSEPIADLIGSDGPAARHVQRGLGQTAAALPAARAQTNAAGVDEAYTRLAATLQVAVIEAGASLPSADLGAAVERSGLLVRAIAAAAAERDLGLVVHTGTGEPSPSGAALRNVLVTEQLALLSQWAELGGEAAGPLRAQPQDESGQWSLRTAREALATADPAGGGLTPGAWSEITASHLATLESARRTDIDAAATAVADERRAAAIMLGAMAALLLSSAIAGVLLAGRVARIVSRRAAAGPRIAEGVDSGQADVEAAWVEAAGVVGAEATPHATAPEPGSPDRSPPEADTFVNIARRNQALLGRQLSLIDALERHEEDPDTLASLYRLDHLATRMRRNAESLLVLAGIDAGRRLREPMPLADVIRTAAGEIEQYERVDVMQHTDPSLLAHAALPAAHLLAEIIENAAQFSPSASRVLVMASATTAGVRIAVTDTGLGMTPDEITAAEAVLSSAGGGAGHARLGFHVVARIARRLGATVSIHPASITTAESVDAGDSGPPQGLTVCVELPAAVLVPASRSADVPIAAEPVVPADPVVPINPADPASVGVAVPRQGSAPQERQVRHATLPPASLIPPPAPSFADAESAGAMLPRRRARRAMAEAEELAAHSPPGETVVAAAPLDETVVATGQPRQPAAEQQQPPAQHPTDTEPPTQAAREPLPATPAPDRPIVAPDAGDVASLRRRAVLASQALSELSMLSSYRPDAAPAGPAPELARRSRADVASPVPPATLSPPRERGASQVRTLLSGFTSGVGRARGVTAGSDHSRAGTDPSGAVPTTEAHRDERSTT